MASVGTETMGRRFFPRLHWSAIIAGVFLALAVHIVMGLIGAAIGFAAAPADSQGVGIGAAIWALITPFVASLLGAWLAIRLSGEEDKAGANTHGILVWCIGLVAGALFLTGTLATGAMSAGTAASGNLGPAQRMARSATGQDRPTRGQAEATQDQAGKAGAAATGGAALAAIAGLLGALVGSGLALRRGGEKRGGWKIAIQRREDRHEGAYGGRTQERGYGTTYGAGTSTGTSAGTTAGTGAGVGTGASGMGAGGMGGYGGVSETTRESRIVTPTGDRPEDGGATDPYHH